MKPMHSGFAMVIAGFCAGCVTGLFGAGGGMVLVPLLALLSDIPEENVFSASVAIIFPVCLVSILAADNPLPLQEAFPYMLGGSIGGLIAGKLAGKIGVIWLHRGLGLLILWGGVRYLC